mmetsp:Transcript_19619/g.34990  ORF Transcript_19619/g.34990 Transcript_19619/m.34990 type:complete len:128 (+) Transcript_19619:376-759(+)
MLVPVSIVDPRDLFALFTTQMSPLFSGIPIGAISGADIMLEGPQESPRLSEGNIEVDIRELRVAMVGILMMVRGLIIGTPRVPAGLASYRPPREAYAAKPTATTPRIAPAVQRVRLDGLVLSSGMER